MTIDAGLNWAGNHRYTAGRLAAPTTIAELRAEVTAADHARAIGSRHSFNALCDTEGTLISTAALPGEILIDADGSRVHVPAGVRYGELAHRLEAEGFALSAMASLPHISVGGAIATGTHGSGDGAQSLAATVSGLELMTADGDLRRLVRGDDDFAGAVVSLGALGIVTRVTLDLEPTYQVEQRVYEGLPVEAALDNLDAITSGATSVSLFTTWKNPDVIDQVWHKRRPDRDADAPATVFGAVPAPGPRHPVPGNPAFACTTQLGAPGAWLDRLPHFRLDHTPSSGAEIQSEYLVPRRHAVDALRAIRSIAGRIAPLLQVAEVRTVAADDLWLSPASGEDVVALHFTWHPRTPEVLAFLPTLEAALEPFEARPHWGKVSTIEPDCYAELYPRLGDFRGLVDRFDPHGVFRNDQLRATVLP
jgi:xylitol oxidase